MKFINIIIALILLNFPAQSFACAGEAKEIIRRVATVATGIAFATKSTAYCRPDETRPARPVSSPGNLENLIEAARIMSMIEEPESAENMSETSPTVFSIKPDLASKRRHFVIEDGRVTIVEESELMPNKESSMMKRGHKEIKDLGEKKGPRLLVEINEEIDSKRNDLIEEHRNLDLITSIDNELTCSDRDAVEWHIRLRIKEIEEELKKLRIEKAAAIEDEERA
tara:strand:+ start:10415 stop:11089 length:675 start_codon:yes stop_codon:yes gene_type:complete